MAEQSVVRIGNITAGLMLALALVFDGLQFVVNFLHVIPVAGNAIALVLTGYVGITATWIIFPIWFKISQVEYFKGKQALLKIAALGIPAISEFITLLNAIPLIVCGVLVTIAVCRFEDIFGDGIEFAKQLATSSPLERSKLVKQAAMSMATGKAPAPEPEEEDPQYTGLPKPRPGSEEELRRKRERLNEVSPSLDLREADMRKRQLEQFDMNAKEGEARGGWDADRPRAKPSVDAIRAVSRPR